MNSVGPGGERDVGAGVDQESSFQAAVLRSQLFDGGHGFSGQGFQIASGKIFFAKLNVVHARADGFAYFFQEQAATRGFVRGERGAIGDVVEEQRRSPRRAPFDLAQGGLRFTKEKSRVCFGDLRHDFSLFGLRAAQVVFREAIFQKFEGFFRGVEELELFEILR